MRIIRYLMQHKASLAMVALLFAFQTVCDLALPSYTSDMVDVGIQQGGISDGVPEKMTSATYHGLAGSLDASDATYLSSFYVEEDGVYVLAQCSGEARAQLAALIAEPLVRLSGAEPAADEGLLAQQAIEAVKAEYSALGVDTEAMQVRYLWKTGLMMMLMVVLACLAHVVMNYFATRNAATIARDLRAKLFAKVVSFSPAEVNSFSAASLITRATNDIQQIQMTSLMLQRMLIYSFFMAVGATIMIARTNVSMVWTILLAIGVILVSMAVLMAVTMPKFKLMQKLIDKVNLVSREALTGVSVVRAFNRQSYEEDRFAAASTDLMKTQLFTARAMSLMMPIMTLVMNGVAVLIVAVGAHYVDAGTVQTGDLIAFITYSMQVIASFLFLGMVAVVVPRAEVAAKRVDDVIGTEASILDPADPKDSQLLESIDRNGLTISFSGVGFAYPGAEAEGEEAAAEKEDPRVLRDLTFTFGPGQTCAIVGGTGFGKSTILRLLMRFFDVTEGSITVNGIDLREISQSCLHGLFGYVPQKNYLFEGTVGSNVSYGKLDADSDEIQRALAIAQAADFVAAKEDGVDAPVSQGGTNFSGGQRQRLAIARALATDAKALLFDDSFSALDYKTDAMLREELKRSCGDRTKVIVAQRIATVMHADCIVVLADGAVAGVGTHSQLMTECPEYREIALSQLSEAELNGEVAR